MSRPDSMAETSGRAAFGRGTDPAVGAAAAPLKVVAERLSAEEARAADDTEVARIVRVRERRAALATVAPPIPTALSTTPPGVAAGVVPSPAPGTVAPSAGALSPVAAPGLPVLAPLPRRSGFAELFLLITGRRRTGRHRPDCVRSQSWSMFSPQRRPRRSRRRWVRSRV